MLGPPWLGSLLHPQCGKISGMHKCWTLTPKAVVCAMLCLRYWVSLKIHFFLFLLFKYFFLIFMCVHVCALFFFACVQPAMHVEAEG